MLEAGLIPVDDDAIAVLADRHVVHPHLSSQLGMSPQVAVLAVDGDEPLGSDDVEKRLELVLIGVARHVHVGVAPMEHSRSGAGQARNHAAHGCLVAGDRRRRDEDGVVLLQLDVLVALLSDEREGCKGFPLAAGGDEQLLSSRQLRQILDVDDGVVGVCEETEIASGRRNSLHRSSEERHLSVGRDAGVQDLLYAVDMRREAGRHHPALGVLDDRLDRLPE